MNPTSSNSSKETDDKNSDRDQKEISPKITPKAEKMSSDSESSEFEIEYPCEICELNFPGLKPLRQHLKGSKHQKALHKIKLQKKIEQGDDDDDEDSTLDKNKTFAECKACDKEFNGPESYHTHMRSKAHKKRVARNKILEKAMEDGKVNKEKLKQLLKAEGESSALHQSVGSDLSDSDEDDKSNHFECEECGKVFSGLEPYRDHLTSKVHKKTLKQKKLLEKLILSDKENVLEIIDDDIICKVCHLYFSGPENAKDHLKSKRHLEWVEFLKWKKGQKNLKNQEVKSEPWPRDGPSGAAGDNNESNTDSEENEK